MAVLTGSSAAQEGSAGLATHNSGKVGMSLTIFGAVGEQIRSKTETLRTSAQASTVRTDRTDCTASKILALGKDDFHSVPDLESRTQEANFER
jgi:hypothetical protein